MPKHRWQVVVLCAVALILWLLAIERRLTREAVQALANSDRAFNEGRLRPSLQAAHRVTKAYTPGSPYVEQGAARLRAIAVGSEATGRLKSALLAWSALAASSFDAPHAANRAAMAQQAVQHVERLLPTRSDSREAEGRAKARSLPVAAAKPPVPATRVGWLLVAFGFLGGTVFCTGPGRCLHTWNMVVRRSTLIAIGLTAAVSWCIGWLLV